MTDLQCLPSAPSASPPAPSASPWFSLRLSQKAKQKFSLPSRKEALENVAVEDETPFKNYRKYKPRKLVNTFVKERYYYNNPDGIDLFDEFSDDNFINDCSTSSDESIQEGSIQSKSSSESDEDRQNRTAEKPISRKGWNQRKARRSASQVSDSDEEELARPLKAHKQRLYTGLSSNSEDSSGDELALVVQRKKRHGRVSIQSDWSSGDDDRNRPRASTPKPSTSDPPKVSQMEVKIEAKEETSIQGENSIRELQEAEESRSKNEESFSVANSSFSYREHSAIKRHASDDKENCSPDSPGSQPAEAPAPEVKTELKKEKCVQSKDADDRLNGMDEAGYVFGTQGEKSCVDPSSSSDDTPDSINGDRDSNTDNEPNGPSEVDCETDSMDSFIATSSSSDGTPDWDTPRKDKPCHEELVCNYRQRKRPRKHPAIRKKRRICLPSDSDSSCSSDSSGGGDDKSHDHLDDSAIPRLPSKRATRMRENKMVWEEEVLGSYRNEREKKSSKTKLLMF